MVRIHPASFRPDPRVLRPVAHRGSQGWPLSKWFSAYYIFRPFLDWPEQDGKLGRVGGGARQSNKPDRGELWRGYLFFAADVTRLCVVGIPIKRANLFAIGKSRAAFWLRRLHGGK